MVNDCGFIYVNDGIGDVNSGIEDVNSGIEDLGGDITIGAWATNVDKLFVGDPLYAMIVFVSGWLDTVVNDGWYDVVSNGMAIGWSRGWGGLT